MWVNIDFCFRIVILVILQGCIDGGTSGKMAVGEAKDGVNVAEDGDETESKVCVEWMFLLSVGFVWVLNALNVI